MSWIWGVAGVVTLGALAVYLGLMLPPWHPNQAVLAVSLFGLAALVWSRALPAAVVGAAIGLVCSLGVGVPWRISNVMVGVAVAILVELTFRPTTAMWRAVRARTLPTGPVPITQAPAPLRRTARHQASALRREVRRLPGRVRRTAERAPTVLRHGTTLIRSTITGPGSGLGLTSAERGALLRDGEVLLSFAAAALYGASWLAAQQFYGSLGVSPEEVGVGTVDLLLISGVVAVLLATAVLLLDILWRRARHAALRVPAFTIVAAVIAGLIAPWPVAVHYALAGAGIAAVTASSDGARPRRSARWIPAAAALILLALTITSYSMSGVYRDRVVAGQPVTPGLAGFQIAVLWAPATQVFPLDGEDLPPGLSEGDCVHRLGNANGVTVFYRSGKVFRVPAEAVLSRTCEAS
jgi:hypothetical protein